MRLLLQWTLRDPADWVEIQPADYAALPRKNEPQPGQLGGQNNQLGYLFDLCVQGVCFAGYDHYHAAASGDDLIVTVWNDDLVDWPIGQRYARVWTFRPLAPDANLGNAINTRQSQVVYADNLVAFPGALPYVAFVAPANPIHGIWCTDAKVAQHMAARKLRGWREWTDGLAASELDENGMLKDQRAQGRYQVPRFTITYYQRSDDLAVDWDIGGAEKAMNSTTAASATVTMSCGAGGTTSYLFTSPSNEPNSANWPNGDFHAQADITAIGADLSLTSSLGNFRRVNSGATSVLENAFSSSWNSTTGTGLKLNTATAMDFAAGSAADRFGYQLPVVNTNTMKAQDITIRVNTTDSYIDGPWTAAATPSMPMLVKRPQFYRPITRRL